MIPGKSYTPEIVLQIIWRRKWLILIPAVLISVGGIAWTYRQVDLYKSESTILVVPQQVPTEYVRATVTTRIEDRLGAITQQLLSRTQLERIILDFNLYPIERKTGIMEDIVEGMRGDVQVAPIRGDAFVVGFQSEDPRIAMRVTERLASMFIDQSLRDRQVLAEGTTQFLESELEAARRSLIDKEREVESYRRQHNGQMPDQLASNQATINSIETQIQNLNMLLNRDKERQIGLERQLADLEAMEATVLPQGPLDYNAHVQKKIQDMQAGGGATVLSAAEQLKVSQNRLQSARMRLKPEHPEVQKLEREVVKAQEAADLEAANTVISSTAGLSPAEQLKRNSIQAATQQLATLERQIGENIELERKLRQALGAYQARVEGTPTREVEMTDLTRNYSILQQQYGSLLTKWQDAQISANLEQRQIGESFKILDAARLPSRPYYPDRPRYYLLAIVAGLAIGFGIAALVEYLDRTMRSEDDVRVALTLPVLAAIPLVADPVADRRRRLIAFSASAVAVVMLTAAAAAWNYLR